MALYELRTYTLRTTLPPARRSRSTRERSVAVIAIVWSPMNIEIVTGTMSPPCFRNR